MKRMISLNKSFYRKLEYVKYKLIHEAEPRRIHSQVEPGNEGIKMAAPLAISH